MMPVCTPTGAGRSSNALVDIFCENQRKKLSECDVLDSVVYVKVCLYKNIVMLNIFCVKLIMLLRNFAIAKL